MSGNNRHAELQASSWSARDLSWSLYRNRALTSPPHLLPIFHSYVRHPQASESARARVMTARASTLDVPTPRVLVAAPRPRSRARRPRDANARANRRDVNDTVPETGRDVVALFRDELRLDDNDVFAAAVRAARRSGGRVACVYAWDEDDDGQKALGGAARAWVREALDALDASIRERYGGGGLQYYRGNAADAVKRACEATGARRAFAPRRRSADRGEATTSYEMTYLPDDGSFLFNHDEVKIDVARGNEDGYFGTLMPFVRATEARRVTKPRKPKPAPDEATTIDLAGKDGWTHRALDDLGIVSRRDARVDWAKSVREEWRDFSERGALERWELFLTTSLVDYERAHGRADVDPSSVSRLSPYVRFGQISPRRMYHDLATRPLGKDGVPGRELSKTFWRRLYRRELAHWQLRHFPNLLGRSIRAHYDGRPWREGDEADEAFHRWCRGETGFPAVDAGMRRLCATGWMHQTERMIAATFLVDYARVHWSRGANWFNDTLVDADVAINSMMWQNAGKSGFDQWEVFAGELTPDGSMRAHDPDGACIARWIPELAALPAGHLRYQPWTASAETLERARVVLGETYPRRLYVDIDAERDVATSDITSVRGAELARAARCEMDDEGDDASRPPLLVDPTTRDDLILVPASATLGNADALIRASTRREYKKSLRRAIADVDADDLRRLAARVDATVVDRPKRRDGTTTKTTETPTKKNRKSTKSRRRPRSSTDAIVFDRAAARASRRAFRRGGVDRALRDADTWDDDDDGFWSDP